MLDGRILKREIDDLGPAIRHSFMYDSGRVIQVLYIYADGGFKPPFKR
jgi:hypothetical protein